MKNRFLKYMTISAVAFAAAGCQDDFMRNEAIGEGEAYISATVDFKPMSSALSQTRTTGNALKDISSLHVLLYDYDTKGLIKSWKVDDYTQTDEGRTDSDAENGHSAEASTRHATFKLPERIEFGKYYMYAVANIPDLLTNTAYSDAIKTVEGLKDIPLAWNAKDVAANGQMLGCLMTRKATLPITDEPLILNETNMELHAWLRRAASKVTVAFDGTSLEEGVSIYLKALRIKKIPRICKLGNDNKIAAEGDLIETGEEVTYCKSATYDATYPALVTKERPYYPCVEKKGDDGTSYWAMDPDAHSETNPHSLFFYENNQGTGPDKRQEDENHDTILDKLYEFQKMEYCTYIEVDTYYESTNPKRLGRSNITYRFMLGQDVEFDYNAKRNCHYKLTLHFNGFANDPDWRIDYVTRLGVTQPETVDYRGMYFEKNEGILNLGNTFKADNVINVTSYMYKNFDWVTRIPVVFKIEYRDAGSTEFTETLPDWLDDFTKTDKGDGKYELKINYKNEPYLIQDINDDLSKNPEKSGPYDLSTKGGEESMNTANSYIVDAKGTYRFPLVYGNAITGGAANPAAYTCNIWYNPNTDKCLTNFVNYKNEAITDPYILDDVYGSTHASGVTASLVWQDAPNLITDIRYNATDYNGKGGISFSTGDIREGNAVIALKDPEGKIMWSWHIWVTAIHLSKEIQITNHQNQNYGGGVQFGILPVNLGWCSGGTPVRYYDRHECEVRITQIISDDGQEGMSQTVKIIQQPHIAVPCGNNPYFQWGRKDPFVAAGDGNYTSKTWYDASGLAQTEAPSLMYDDDASRVITSEATASLIQNPDKWQNGPRVENNDPNIPGDFRPADNESIFFNLWDNSGPGSGIDVTKTIYDPCPAGYHVSPYYTFTGFTEHGGSISTEFDTRTFVATEANMMPSDWEDSDKYNTNIVEFYTDKTKLISIGFPANGYRDWDDNANVLQYGQGEIWHAETPFVSWGYKPYVAYHLEFTRLTVGFIPHIYPWNNYYATDGFPIRPTRCLH